MKCFSLKQPYADLIVFGEKIIELRKNVILNLEENFYFMLQKYGYLCLWEMDIDKLQ